VTARLPGGSELGNAMTTITKKDLVDRIADNTANKRVVVKKIIQSFLDEIVSELGQGNRLEFRDFGVFEIRSRAARIAQNPKTMEKVYVPSKRTVKFKIGRLMKQKLFANEVDAESAAQGGAEAQAASDGR
jgi:integration host factor subunit beta